MTRYNETLCIHLKEIKLYVKDSIRDPVTSFWMVIYIEVDKYRNSSKFSVSMPWNYGGMIQRYVMTL